MTQKPVVWSKLWQIESAVVDSNKNCQEVSICNNPKGTAFPTANDTVVTLLVGGQTEGQLHTQYYYHHTN